MHAFVLRFVAGSQSTLRVLYPHPHTFTHMVMSSGLVSITRFNSHPKRVQRYFFCGLHTLWDRAYPCSHSVSTTTPHIQEGENYSISRTTAQYSKSLIGHEIFARIPTLYLEIGLVVM